MDKKLNKYQFLFHPSACIRFTDEGKGFPLVLLHGYLETLDIWGDFANDLAKKIRVISMDIMGHAWTRSGEENFTVEYSAELVKSVLDYLKIDKAFIVGHSMGGYTMLAMEEMFPEKVEAMCFFHSVSWADTDEKKANRDREIQLIKEGKRSVLYNVNVPKCFADDNLGKFADKVEYAKSLAMESTDDGIIAALKGMKARKDRTFIVERTAKPILFIVGEKDNYIPKEKLLALSQRAKNKTVVILHQSGHMGFIEEKETSLQDVTDFLNKNSF
jgi:pimeloyl-ACP methyl ester carboxylesterase